MAETELLARGWRVDEPLTPEHSIRNYNNFYEFTTEKEGVAAAAAKFNTDGWKVVVDGLVHKPRNFSIDDLQAISRPEERVYRMRCVEAWSMVIPWAGIPFARLLEPVEPMSHARYVAFQTLLDPVRMPGQRTAVLEWPYVEGLRLDEAMHPLTLLATGLYAKMLPPQDGASGSISCSVEIRVQGNQVDRPDHVGGRSAGDHLESHRADRIWLLRKRKPRR